MFFETRLFNGKAEDTSIVGSFFLRDPNFEIGISKKNLVNLIGDFVEIEIDNLKCLCRVFFCDLENLDPNYCYLPKLLFWGEGRGDANHAIRGQLCRRGAQCASGGRLPVVYMQWIVTTDIESVPDY